MGFGQLGFYRPDGRLKGSFVYMLLCRDEGPIYVKVGITDSPYRRLLTLKCGCPVTPRRFCSFEVRSRDKALRVERSLHKALTQWAAHGEWFKVEYDDKRAFNEAWKAALERHHEDNWPCVWEQFPVQKILEYGERRKRYFQRMWKNSGLAYKDFVADSARLT